jgi:hypothetical protein
VRQPKRRTLLLAATTTLALGCVSYSSFKEARTLDPGVVRVDVAAGATTARPTSGATAFLRGGRPAPYDNTEQASVLRGLEAQVRYGVLPGLDFGAKTNISSLELNATVQLTRSDRFDVALAPAVQRAVGGNFDDEGWEMWLVKLPLLADVRFGGAGQHAVVFGPALAKSWGAGTNKNSGYTVDALFAGGTIGISLEVARILRLFPEIAIYTPLAGQGVALPGYVVRVSPDVGPGTPVLLQASLGIALGGAGRER